MSSKITEKKTFHVEKLAIDRIVKAGESSFDKKPMTNALVGPEG